MVGSSSLSLLASLTALATGALAINCTGNKFAFTGPNFEVCLPKGGISNPPSAPDELACPANWYWYTDKTTCVPTTRQASNAIDCPSGFTWTPRKGWCKSVCTRQEFWYTKLETCLPKGGITNPPSPPSDVTCPTNWYWYKLAKECVPKNPDYTAPDCGRVNVWSDAKGGCVAPPRPTCGRNEFYWPDRNCCLPHNGPPTPPTPPPGQSCPPKWSWHKVHKCCTPHHPNPPKPTCPGGGHWNPGPCRCDGGPEPSHRPHNPYKRRTGEMTLCPKGLEACPIDGLFGGEYECLNTKVEIESCGGCASTGKGQDCTQIPNAWNVGCDKGTCKVYSCLQGYGVNTNGTACQHL